MNSLEATPVTLTSEERAELEGLARSTKTEHRTRLKARIVLMAAEGAATRAIGRALGCANWTGPLIAEALGDVHVQHVWRFLRAHKIDLSGRKSWCVSNDPEFAAKAAEIVGLYMAPPDNAVVL